MSIPSAVSSNQVRRRGSFLKQPVCDADRTPSTFTPSTFTCADPSPQPIARARIASRSGCSSFATPRHGFSTASSGARRSRTLYGPLCSLRPVRPSQEPTDPERFPRDALRRLLPTAASADRLTRRARAGSHQAHGVTVALKILILSVGVRIPVGLIDRPPHDGGLFDARRPDDTRWRGNVREPRGKARFRTLGRLPITLRTPFQASGKRPPAPPPRQDPLMLRTALPRTAAALLVGSAAFASVGCQVAPLPEGYSWNIKPTDKSHRGASHRNGLDASRVDTVNAATNSGGKAYNFASALPGTSRSAPAPRTAAAASRPRASPRRRPLPRPFRTSTPPSPTPPPPSSAAPPRTPRPATRWFSSRRPSPAATPASPPTPSNAATACGPSPNAATAAASSFRTSSRRTRGSTRRSSGWEIGWCCRVCRPGFVEGSSRLVGGGGDAWVGLCALEADGRRPSGEVRD